MVFREKLSFFALFKLSINHLIRDWALQHCFGANYLKNYIESGILELYVLGNLSLKERKDVEDMCLKYPEVSQAFWNATHEVLSGKATAEDSLKGLEAKLKQIKRTGW